MKAARVKLSRRGEADLAHHLDPGERRDRRGRARMNDRALAGVIVVEAVRQRAAGENRVGGGDLVARPDKPALALAAERARRLKRDRAEVHRRGGERDSERVQKDELCLLPNVRRHAREIQFAHEGAYFRRAGLHFFFPGRFAAFGVPPSARMSGAMLFSLSRSATMAIASSTWTPGTS